MVFMLKYVKSYIKINPKNTDNYEWNEWMVKWNEANVDKW